eukprot:TRINITY_DN50624_c0_g1_i1.p1 TRINITY_DN50624_c0_g1~~TRINITY_DN50624_c0_g1_i1.p1  ORF type:complete len:276 (+),score=84.81 TRINITY_DN50624_c0_g1_i1:80-829(+)
MGNAECGGSCGLQEADCIGGVGDQQHAVAMVGLDGAGKTTMCLSLMELENARAPPPTGMADIFPGLENKVAKGRMNEWIYYIPNAPGRPSMRILDLGGAEEHRGRWTTKYKEVKGLVFVVDALDKKRLPEAKRALQQHVLSHVNSAQVPVLILANVKDRDAPRGFTPAERRELEAELKQALGIAARQNDGRFTPVSELCRPPADKVIFHLCADPMWTRNLEEGFLELRRSIVDNIRVLQGSEERQIMLR